MKLKTHKCLIVSFAVLSLLAMSACGNQQNKKKTNLKENTENTTKSNPNVSSSETTYQHIALAEIKDDKWDKYVDAMHNNIAHTHQEPGNILFTLFQPEDGSHQVVFMERYKNRAAFEKHLKAEYLPEAVNNEAVIGKMEIDELKEIPEIPPVEPQNSDDIVTPRNVIVFFNIKPKKRETFIKAIAELTPHARLAKGNVRFNIFQQVDDENKFVVLESWDSIANHKTHLAQDYSQKFNKAVEGCFVTDPMLSRFLAKDISK